VSRAVTAPLRALPGHDALEHELRWCRLRSAAEVEQAIREMWLRGAPLIGAAAAFGLALALREDASDAALQAAFDKLAAARPTAVNLAWALKRVRTRALPLAAAQRAAAAWSEATAIADEDAAVNSAIGDHGLALLTHCNAGALATMGWGTATAPLYKAHAAGLPLEVWVDETRPRNQGASLTAWELGQAGVLHRLVADNAGGHLMQTGAVDLVIVGCDRVAANGDVCNKIGTYLKALAAHDNAVPFYVAMPLSTLDPSTRDGAQVPIEERDAREVTHISGCGEDGVVRELRIAPAATGAANPGFDITPARLVTGLITERGIVAAQAAALRALVAGTPSP
jgi:methylthioribose-1-phosphate isomerase